MKVRPEKPGALSRRRFVALMAAGSAALVAAPGAAATARRTRGPARPAAVAMSAADRKEFLRQQASTLDTLRTIRKHAMPPGTEMAVVFRPLRPARKGS